MEAWDKIELRREGLLAPQGVRAAAHGQRNAMTKLTFLAVAMASLPAIALAQDARSQAASLPAIALAQDARSQAASYCFDLSRVVDLAITKERFASIAGRPRQGSYVGTSLVLAGWKDCSLYGAATYTCDSAEMDTAEDAEKARAAILDQVKACLGAGWAEATERSSPNYVVLHDAMRPVAITLSTDQTDNKKHVVRLIVFVRRN
jgi:hypothetical protein